MSFASSGWARSLPADQARDDAGSLVFDTQALGADMDLVGQAELELEFSSDKACCPAGCTIERCAPGRQCFAHHLWAAEPDPHCQSTSILNRLNRVNGIFAGSGWMMWPAPCRQGPQAAIVNIDQLLADDVAGT